MDVASVSHPGQALPAIPDTQNPNWLVENREMIQTVKRIADTELMGQDTELTFALDRDTKRPVVRGINRQTGEIVWQMPPEYVLALAQQFNESA